MKPTLYTRLLGFSLFGVAMWFFGNLYEAVAIGPNMLHDSLTRLRAWQSFIVDTNPAFYYVPVTIVAALILPVLLWKAHPDPVLKRKLKMASVSIIIALIVGTYMIIRINTKIFFGNLTYLPNAHELSTLWNILNVVRMIFAGISLYFILECWVRIKR